LNKIPVQLAITGMVHQGADFKEFLWINLCEHQWAANPNCILILLLTNLLRESQITGHNLLLEIWYILYQLGLNIKNWWHIPYEPVVYVQYSKQTNNLLSLEYIKIKPDFICVKSCEAI